MPTSSSANYSTDDQQMKQSLADEFDLQKLAPEFYQNPYAIYKVIRELAPVKVLADGSLFLTRYEDLKLVYSDAKRFSSDKKLNLLLSSATALCLNITRRALCLAIRLCIHKSAKRW